MLTKKRRLALATAVLCIGFGAGRPTAADGIVLNTPAGLSPGAAFRFVFITDAGTLATSSTISTYNTLVNTDATTEAGGGLVTYNGVALTFSAIASTATTNAIDNVGVTGAAVYLANGTPIASNDGTGSGGLWSGSIFNPINEQLDGTITGGADPFTGTLPSGTGDPGHQLGTSSPTIGSATFSDSAWVDDFNFISGVFPGPVYGISQVLVAASVPEPSTLLMAATAVSAGCAFGWSRRRRNRRRV